MSEIGHIKIAITTNSLTRVDVAFALAKQIVFYGVTYDAAEFLDAVRFSGEGAAVVKGAAKNGGQCWMLEEAEATEGGTDRLTPRVNAVKGCHVLFTKGLSDLAAVKLHDNKVFPVKMEKGREVDEVIRALQKMMNSAHPPLWLRKALGYGTHNSEYQLEKAA